MLFNIYFNKLVRYVSLSRRQLEQEFVEKYQLLRYIIDYVRLLSDAKLLALKIYKLFFFSIDRLSFQKT